MRCSHPDGFFLFSQYIHQHGHLAWECLLYTFPKSREPKVMMLKKPKIKQEVGKMIFSFLHISSSLKVFYIHYLERLDLKINLDFYLNSTVREGGMIFSLKGLNDLSWNVTSVVMETSFSCNCFCRLCFYLICVKKYQAAMIWNNVA